MGNKKRKSNVKIGKKPKYKFGDLGRAIYKYFDSKGLEKCTYEESLKIALKCCPHSAYKKSHFAWYKSHYRKFILPIKK